MSAVGSSADNALAESFNATFKRETLQGRKSWPNEREARLDAFRWLHRYNTRRRHSRLGQRSPIAFGTPSTSHQLRWHQPHNPCSGFEVKAHQHNTKSPVLPLGRFVWITERTRGRCLRCAVRPGRWLRFSRSGWRFRAIASSG